MPETPEERGEVGPATPIHAEELLGLGPEVPVLVSQALDAKSSDDVDRLVTPLHPAEVADLLQQLGSDHRKGLVEHLRPQSVPDILAELDETVRDEVVERIGIDALAASIAMLDTDDALMLLSSLDEGKQRQVMDAIPTALRAALALGLTYPEDSAGRLMQRDFVAVPTFWNVGETIDYLRDSENLPNDFYDIFVVDPGHRPVGTVALSRVLRSKRPVRMQEIMDPHMTTVPVGMDQEEVAYIFAQHDLTSTPVVDDTSRLIGVIMVDDVVDVIHEEAEEDIMHLGGVQGDDLYEAVIDTGKGRFSWLFINLFTAVVASIVIGFFQNTIEQIVILAVLMPIAASMGGNAGTQTLTVAVRAIATKELTSANAARVLTKEILVGALNGVSFAIIVGAVAWVWSGDIAIGAVIAGAMMITMVVAGLAGMAIPIGLSRTGVDPAVASGVFLTTITDVVAFFAFLGLAAWFLL